MRWSVRSGLAVLVLLMLAGGFASALAQAVEPPTPAEMKAARSAPLFTSYEILELTLEADCYAMRREDRRDEDSEERPAILRWANPDGTRETQEIQVQTRGNFRLARRNCDFPPLRLNLKKEPVEGTLFEGQNKLKLVGVCKVRQDYWEQYVVAEYLTYRTFNLLTDLSFRVRPARVTYVDTSREDDTFTRFAFLIEDDSQMAARNGGRIHDWESGQLDPRLLEKNHAILVDIFQFMIGNTDWSGVQMHNMKLFRGFCPDQMSRRPELYEAAFDLFREKKDEIYRMWRGQEGLSEDKLRESLEYFDEFYEILDDPGRIERSMLRDCRRVPTLSGP